MFACCIVKENLTAVTGLLFRPRLAYGSTADRLDGQTKLPREISCILDYIFY